jgi:hypothetical protein
MFLALVDSGLTPQQVQHDEALKLLARRPGEALRHWVRLSQADRTAVVTYMALFYDVNFAKRFLEGTKNRARPDLVISITNNLEWAGLPNSVEKLKAAGWRLRLTEGSIQYWVHPSGKELWLLPPPKALPPQNQQSPGLPLQSVPGPPPPGQHPNVQEARLYADEYEAEANEFRRRSRELQAMVGQPGYARAYCDLMADITDYFERLGKTFDETVPELKKGLTGPELDALEQELNRLKGLPMAEFGQGDLPLPKSQSCDDPGP